MQATARMASVVSSTLPARRRLIRDVRRTYTTMHTVTRSLVVSLGFAFIASAQEAPLPPKALKLKQSYEAAIQRATSPITKTYIAELNKLKTEYTKAADLQGAIAIESEIKQFEGATQSTQTATLPTAKRLKSLKTIEEFTAWITGSMWSNEDGESLSFEPSQYIAKWKDSVPGTRPSPYATTITEVGKVNFKYTNGDEGFLIISDDLKTCTVPGRKPFNRNKEEKK